MKKEIKIRIFAEYLGCKAIKGKKELIVELTNIEYLVNNGYKLKLKSVYNLSKEEMFYIAEEMRYNRALQESFRDFEMNGFRVSSDSRNKTNYHTAMISYVAKTDKGLMGNWFRLSSSYSIDEFKSKGYDCGSCWSYIMNRKFKERKSLEDLGLAVMEE